MKKSEPENKEILNLWTICKNPADYPNKFTARQFIIKPNKIIITHNLIVEDTLEEIRQHMQGLVRIPRDINDDPVIVEIWI
jgi:hypothetical protein